jgi:RNA polymerase nonessential primary-like sigma factor
MSSEEWSSRCESANNINKVVNATSFDTVNRQQTLKEKKTEMLGRILTTREKEIIALRFGFATGDSMTLAQVGKNLNLTRERVRQIESKALNKMRGNPRLQFLRDFLN